VLLFYVTPAAVFFIVFLILLIIVFCAKTYTTRRQLRLKFRDVKCSLLMQAGDNYSLHGGTSNKQWGFDPNRLASKLRCIFVRFGDCNDQLLGLNNEIDGLNTD
jgi:hypothetical protein